MKRLILLILILSFLKSDGQELSGSLGGSVNFVSVDSYYNQVNINNSYSISGLMKNYYGRVVGFESGFVFSYFQYDVKYDYSLFIPVATAYPIKNSVSAAYIECPMLFHLRLINKAKWQAYTFGGVGISMLVNANAKTVFNNGIEGSLSSVESSIPAFQFGLGSNYKINEKVALGIKSSYKEFTQAFSVLMKDSPSIISAWVEVCYFW